jgi:hypothetical protein
MSDTPGWTSPSPEDPPPSAGWGTPAPPGAPPPPGQNWSGAAGAAPSWGATPGGYGAPPVTKPGVIPLRPLGLGEILDGAITTMRTYPKATLAFGAVVAAFTQLLQFFMLTKLISDAQSALTQQEVDAFLAESFVLRVLLTITTYVANTILTGCIAAVVSEAILGRSATLSEAWGRVRRRFWALIGTALLSGLIIFGGFLLLVLPAFYFAVVFALAGPVLILENASPTRALRRSWDLVKGNWWRVFGIILLTYLIAGMIGFVIQVPFGLAGGTGLLVAQEDAASLSTGDIALLAFAAAIASAITGPFISGVMSLLYVDRRMRREGLDVTLAATAAQQTAGPQLGMGYPTA